MSDRSFKLCPNCQQWLSKKDIMEKPSVIPLGMTFKDNKASVNLYLFNHNEPKCGTTFIIPVEQLHELLDESAPEQNLAGTEQCEGRCTDLSDHEPCSAECKFAPYRKLLGRMIEARKAQKIGKPVK